MADFEACPIRQRALLAPPQSNRVAIPWTSIVTSSHLLDPRFPHDRGLSNRCVPGPGSPSDIVGGSSGTALTEHEFQCTWPTVPCRDGGRPWSPNQAHYYPLPAAVNGSSKAASLNKKTTEHGRGPPPLTTTFPSLQSRLHPLTAPLSWTVPPGPPRRIEKTLIAIR
jgi:hypothetical protein